MALDSLGQDIKTREFTMMVMASLGALMSPTLPWNAEACSRSIHVHVNY